MRTTIHLPADLVQAAKVKAAQHGGTLRFPLIGRDEDPKVDVTNADIEAALATEEIERYGQ